ncbi:MAG: TonB-dependent receptor [Pseudomonadota bacterium]
MYSLPKFAPRLVLLVSLGLTLAMRAEAQETALYSIPAGSLEVVIATYSAQSGVSVSFTPDVVQGKQSNGLVGRYAAEEALILLLSESGVASRFTSDKTATLLIPAVSSGPVVLAPIQVRGELIERDLQDTQTSVAVVTGGELERRSDDNFEDLLERVAGVSVSNGDLEMSIRGVNQSGPGAGGGPAISINVDGASITGITRMNIADFSTWDLEQVEILRGPQSTQTGRNALAGAVAIRSVDPHFDREFKLRTEAGNADTLQGAVAANLPLVKDLLALRFSVDHEETDGFVTGENIAGDDYDSEERTTYRAAVRFDPTEHLSAILKYTRFETEDGSGAVDASLFPGRRVTFETVQERLNMETDSFNLRLAYIINDAFRVESETNYFENDTEFRIPTGLDDSNGRNFEQEIKLFYAGARHRGVLGAYYTDLSSGGTLSGTFPAFFFVPGAPADALLQFGFGGDSEVTNYAVFGEFEMQLHSDFKLIAGFRYDREENDNLSSSSLSSDDPDVAAQLPPPTAPIALSASFEAFLPKIGVVYAVNPDVSLSFTAQQGYRAGGAALNFFGDEYEFDPELTWNYELAFRSNLRNGRLVINANAFYTDWNDQQVSEQGPSGNTLDVITVNAGESRIIGGEIDVRSVPITGLEVHASVAYADTEFTDFVTGGTVFTGNEFPYAPKLTAALGVEYAFRSGVFVAADASYTDGSFRDIQNTADLDNKSRYLLNARIGYESDRWSVFAYVTNLTDEDYWNRRDANGTLRPGDPRQYGIVGQLQL